MKQLAKLLGLVLGSSVVGVILGTALILSGLSVGWRVAVVVVVGLAFGFLYSKLVG